MDTYYGKSAFGGIAIGRISVYKKGGQQVKRVKEADPDAEMMRFQLAKTVAVK